MQADTLSELQPPLLRETCAGGIALLTIDRPPANALNQALRQALQAAFTRLADDPSVTAIVLTGAGRGFVAGAEIAELGQPLAPSLPELLSQIAACPKPTAAALHGNALGGGFELALACGLRVAASSTRLGFPEVALGMLPGAGGTVRATWLAGPEAALDLAGSGRLIGAPEAARLGLVDLVTEDDPVAAAMAALRAQLAAGTRPAPDFERPRAPAVARDRLAALSAQQCRKLRSRAPALSLAAVLGAQEADPATALAQERALFLDAVASPAAAALRHLFFAERAAARAPVETELPAREIRRTGVIGAGTMGRGIAMALANAGLEVAICDTEPAALAAGMAAIAESYATARGLDPAEAARRRARITPVAALEALADCDLVIEAAFEDLGVKQAIFATLDRVAKPGAILATNTSYLDVNAIAAATRRPGDVLGLHFFSPAHVMKLLEIARGRATAPDVLKTAVALARRLGKQAVTVGICRGFVGNRMLQARNRAVPQLLLEGARPESIDAAFRDMGWPMGPCEVQDLSGLDIAWRMRRAEGLAEPLADALVAAGRLGRKTGRGWYDYPEPATPVAAPEVAALIAAEARAQGIAPRAISPAEIIARTHGPMIAEGRAILAEGIARAPGDIDVVWVNGYGFPRDLGGPMYWDEARQAEGRA